MGENRRGKRWCGKGISLSLVSFSVTRLSLDKRRRMCENGAEQRDEENELLCLSLSPFILLLVSFWTREEG